tara:strand:- start:603 stop:1160 length:558 start_codon:yes stop_codon:yes gene_type:complete
MDRTLTVKTGGTGVSYQPGWHTCTISKAKYGEYNDSKFIDIWFDGYNDYFKLRVYAKTNKNGEEFAIGQIFRFANAGISDALEGADGNTVIKMDDSAENLKGKQLNVFFYKDSSGYTSVLPQTAPTEFVNVVEEFKINDIQYYKNKAEGYYTKWVLPKIKENESKDPTDTMPSFLLEDDKETAAF